MRALLCSQSCNGVGCRSRTFEPQRSTAVAVDYQKLRLQARSPSLHPALLWLWPSFQVYPCLTWLEASRRIINQSNSAS